MIGVTDDELHDHFVREIPVVVGDLQKLALRRVAGVVEHRVDPSVGRHREIDDPLQVVGALGDAAAGDAAELGGERLAALRRRHQRDPVAAAGHLARDRGADAAAAAGDEADLVGHRELLLRNGRCGRDEGRWAAARR
jgi:hypothetical protein